MDSIRKRVTALVFALLGVFAFDVALRVGGVWFVEANANDFSEMAQQMEWMAGRLEGAECWLLFLRCVLAAELVGVFDWVGDFDWVGVFDFVGIRPVRVKKARVKKGRRVPNVG